MSTLSWIIRESPAGQILRFVLGNRILKYPEEQPGFQLPWGEILAEKDGGSLLSTPSNSDAQTTSTNDARSELSRETPVPQEADLEALERALTATTTAGAGLGAARTTTRAITREQTRPWTTERLEVEQQEQFERATSVVIMPMKTHDGITLVDWYTTDDADNPQNWESGRKAWTAFVICWYTFVVYCASAIYTSSEAEVMQVFHVQQTKASLGLSMYVIGYGLGPMLFSPLSEVPIIGRNIPYIISMFLFLILAVPTALVDNYAGLLVLRTLTGFMGSPALATGGASLQDMYSLIKLPYAFMAWAAGAFCAPALGPLLSGFAVMAKGWRWSLWEILWMAAPTFVIMPLFMPETSADNILLRRAQRLRKLTGNPNIKSRSEIDQGTKKFKDIAWEQLAKPIEVSVRDPAVFFTHIYMSCIYGIYYSFFEVFPLVYMDIYHYNLGDLGLPFLTITVGTAIGIVIYTIYQYYYLEPDIKKNGLRAQEHRLVPACIAVVLLPISLFWFGWTARPSVHWIVCTIGLTLFPLGAFLLFLCVFMYLPLTYPQYAASLFAANDLCRASFAAGSILFARPLFINLGIGPGVSLLAGLLCGGCVGMWVLYFYGAKLRAMSKFAEK